MVRASLAGCLLLLSCTGASAQTTASWTGGNCTGAKAKLTARERQQMIQLHNKMRCAAGTGRVVWNAELACQAQAWADRCKFEHSDSYGSGIVAGENLASGTSIPTAAWMWFTEYTMANPADGQTKGQGHFTAMVWKSTKELGCGICRDGKGVIVCHYADSAPNMQGAYEENVPKFAGWGRRFKKCNMNPAIVKQRVDTFKRWGILKPEPALVTNLRRQFSMGDFLWNGGGSLATGTLIASAAGASIVLFSVLLVARRRLGAQRAGAEQGDQLLGAERGEVRE